jgi:predicted  nucleic acid-binding Zn-ribbon protein
MRVVVVLLLIIGAIAAFFAYRQYYQDQASNAQIARQINDLNSEVQKLQSDNSLLRDQLAKVQEENNHLKGYNDELQKAIATAKITGKLPLVLPYPPK